MGKTPINQLLEIISKMSNLMKTIFEDNEKIFHSILAGASGYILKNTSPSNTGVYKGDL